MWMMGYTGDEFNSINQDSFPRGHKLRPLIARPAANPPPCLTHIHMTTDLLTLNHHISMVEQNKFPRDHQLSGGQQVVVSSRWNPTPEQLQTLEELYRRGTRTPSADQIQHITAELRRYGKIEGKNVFYWFQNHKARERQKRRRQLKANSSDNSSSDHIVANGGKNESSPAGVNRTGLEVEETKNWAFPTNSSTVAERTVSPKAAAKAAAGPDAERKPADHGWLQFDFDDHQLQQQSSSQIMIRRNDTCQTMHLPCSSSSPTNLTIINSSTVNGTSMGLMPPAANQLIKTHQDFDFVDMNIFVGPADNSSDVENFRYCSAVHGGDDHDDGGAAGGELAQQTLQLFPLDRQLNDDLGKKEEHEESGAAMDHSTCSINAVTPHQFFEFLPLKN